MAVFLGLIGEVVAALIAKFAGILTMFTTNTLLVLLLGIMVTGACIGLVMRLVHRR